MIGARVFRSPTGRKRARALRVVQVTLTVSGMLIACALTVGALRHPLLRITAIHVTTDGALTVPDVTAVATEHLHRTVLGFLPADSVALFSRAELASALTAAFPRIASATVERSSPRVVQVTLAERTPQALWCGDVVPPVAHERALPASSQREEFWGTCYFLDATGYLYAQAPLFTGTIYPRYYGSLTHGTPIGQQFLEPGDFPHLAELYQALASTTPLQALLIVDERDIELYTVDGLRIIAPRTEAVAELVRRITAVTARDTLDRTRPIAYVDLRFAPKVFVKYETEAE